MSGPKVVRIRTRREVLATCRRRMARLDASIAEWRRITERNEISDGTALADMLRRREGLAALLQGDEFLPFQKQVEEEIAFVQADLQRRLEEEATRVAAERSARRRMAGTAATLLKALKDAGSDFPAELESQLQAIRTGWRGPVGEAEASIRQAFARVVPDHPGQSLSDRQAQLAGALGGGEGTTTLREWLAGRPAEDDAVGADVDRRIAALEACEGAEVAAPFAERAASIAAEPSAKRRRLLADSLVLDLARVAEERRQRAQLVVRLDELKQELSSYDSDAARKWVHRLDELGPSAEGGAFARALEEGEQLAEEVRKGLAANSRRAAVLSALGKLGYEVREGMATAWATKGQVVLRKADCPGEGVELGGLREGDRMQLRAVSFGALPLDAEAGRSLETRWCGDVQDLRDLLAREGGELRIEQARPVGEVKVKALPSWEWDRGERREVEIDRERAR